MSLQLFCFIFSTCSVTTGFGVKFWKLELCAASHVVFCSRWRQLCLALVSSQLWTLGFLLVYTDMCQTLWYICYYSIFVKTNWLAILKENYATSMIFGDLRCCCEAKHVHVRLWWFWRGQFEHNHLQQFHERSEAWPVHASNISFSNRACYGANGPNMTEVEFCVLRT